MPLIDLTGVQTEFTPLPTDEYDAVFAEFKNGMSQSGNPKVTLIFNVRGGDFDGRKVFMDCSMQPQAFFQIKRALISLGADPESLEGSVDTDAELTALRGTPCTLKVAKKPSNTDPSKMINSIEEIIV